MKAKSCINCYYSCWEILPPIQPLFCNECKCFDKWEPLILRVCRYHTVEKAYDSEGFEATAEPAFDTVKIGQLPRIEISNVRSCKTCLHQGMDGGPYLAGNSVRELESCFCWFCLRCEKWEKMPDKVVEL
jgi:hypothetical protein